MGPWNMDRSRTVQYPVKILIMCQKFVGGEGGGTFIIHCKRNTKLVYLWLPLFSTFFEITLGFYVETDMTDISNDVYKVKWSSCRQV